jgi:type IV secretion system protein VirD4
MLGLGLFLLLVRVFERSGGKGPTWAKGSGLGDPRAWSQLEVAATALAAVGLLVVVAQMERSKLLRPGALGGARRAGRRDLRPFRGGRAHAGATVRLGTHRLAPVHLPAEDHLLVLGPTGSGKSSGLAIPAILEWRGAVVVTDPKGELVRATLAARRQLGQAAVFAPLMEPSDCWNPVGSIVSAEDALRTAGLLMGRPPEKEPFWHDLALQLLQGLLVEAAVTGMGVGDLLAILQAVPAEDIPAELSHPVAQRLTQGATSGGDRTAMGVVATLVAKLAPYATERVAQTTSRSTFDAADLVRGNLKSIYCVVTPHDAPLLRGLVSALLASCWRAIYASPPAVPVLFVLDEFAQLTLLPELPALVQLGRSQGVRMILMGQDLSSISGMYGADTASALWANCRTKLLLAGISEIDLLERTSRLAGMTTLHRRQPDHLDEPVSAHPLLAPDDIRRLPDDRALILRGSGHPAVIRQRRWYRDRALRQLVNLPLEAGLVPSLATGRPLTAWRGRKDRCGDGTREQVWEDRGSEPGKSQQETTAC